MARSKAESSLTVSQIGRIRATQAKKLSGILTRVSRHAAGTLTDNKGNPIEMTASQLKAAEIIKSCVLPQQQATTFQDVTEPEKTREDIEGNVQQELMKALREIPKDQRQALIDSVDQVKQ